MNDVLLVSTQVNYVVEILMTDSQKFVDNYTELLQFYYLFLAGNNIAIYDSTAIPQPTIRHINIIVL